MLVRSGGRFTESRYRVTSLSIRAFSIAILQFILFVEIQRSEFRDEFLVELLQFVQSRLVGGPTDDKTLSVGGGRLGDDVEVNMVNFLVRNPAVVLKVTVL